MPSITIQELLDGVGETLLLNLRAGNGGLDRVIRVPRIQKPGLALTGYDQQLDDGRLLTLGGTEIEFLRSASGAQRTLAVETVMGAHPACIIITRGLEPPEELVECCGRDHIPLMTTSLLSAELIAQVTHFLQDRLSPKASHHGVLLEVLGVGILLLGKSGIGKSEAALDLLVRGYRLVADDVVDIRRLGPNVLSGSGTGIIKHHMEIRGLGIINIKDLFGIGSVLEQHQINLVIELREWRDGEVYDRLGVDDEVYSILGEELPILRIPVRPGRNIATIIEVAARNQILKGLGVHSARDFQEVLAQRLASGQASTDQSSEPSGSKA
ncbi:MAG: HPr(Ser) kinase/phosphatase [Kofleriaceae bacterium]|nr:HPr(Ser) kinase/phosphatase [Kofleriaceae bacterium]